MQRFALSTVQSGSEHYAPFVFAIAMAAGAVWYFVIDFEPGFWPLCAALCLSGGALAIALRRSLGIRAFLGVLVVSGVVSGAFAGKLATLRVEAEQVPRSIGPVSVEGWVVAAQPARRGVRLVLRVHAIDGLSQTQLPRTVRMTQISELRVEPGRFVRCWAVLRPPPAPVIAGDYAFDRQAYYQGLGGVGYVQGRCRGAPLGPPQSRAGHIELQLAKMRRQLAQYVRGAAGERAGGFAAALTSGDRSFMLSADQEALRAAGLAHLLAISGLHMGIVGGLVFLIVWRALSLIEPVALRVPVKKPAALAALVACLTYLIVSGASVSTQRAFIMAAVLFGAVLVDRTALSLRSLAIAMILVVIWSPWSVLTPGFQMSFAATGVLIATYETWQRHSRRSGHIRRRGWVFWCQSLFVTSTVSSLATMPFALFHFERIAGFGLLANLFAMPIVSLVSAPAAAAALVLTPIGLDHLALRVFGFSLEGVLIIAHAFQDRIGDNAFNASPYPAFGLLIMTSGIVLYCYFKRFVWQVISVAACAGLSLIIWSLSGLDRMHFAPSGDVYFAYADGRVERVEIYNGPGLAPLRYSERAADQVCPKSEVCRLAFLDFELLTQMPESSGADGVADNVERILIVTSNDISDDRNRDISVTWADIIAENGITFAYKNGQLIKQDKPSCESRPWRRCLMLADADPL
ncbi:MAG: ComEC/Rec2 family competence protein [Pseudomonadota bacterium]